MTSSPIRLERGVYRRTLDGTVEYGSRCDEISGRTTWAWGFSSQSKARQDYQARRAAVRETRAAGHAIVPTRGPLGPLCEEYLRSIHGKRLSYPAKKRMLDWWVARFGMQPVLTIRAVQIEAAMAELVRSGRSPSTANRYAACLRRMMRKIVSPFDHVLEVWKRIEFYEEPESIPVPMTDDEESRLYAALGYQDALYARLDVLIGIRLSQFFTLRWEWLVWEQAILHLPRFKRHPARLLPVPQEAMAIFAVLWQQQDRPMGGWVFPVRKQTFLGAGKAGWKPGPVLVDFATHLNPHNWYARNFRPAVLQAQLRPGITFHTLRKTWASRLGAHTPAPVLRILGGWSSSDVVQRYCLPFAEAMREAMERGATRKSVNQVSHEKISERARSVNH